MQPDGAFSYDGVYLWKAAWRKLARLTWTKCARRSKSGAITFDGPDGKVTVQKNHHVTKNVYIGETKANGQFKILKEFNQVYGEPFLKGTFMKEK